MRQSPTESRHRGSWSRAELVRAVAAGLTTGTVICYSLLLGHGNGEGRPDDPPAESAGTGTLGRVSSGVSDEPPERRRGSLVGVTLEGGRSDTTLLQVRRVRAPDNRSAPKGQEWYGIRARTCRHANAGDRGRSPWSEWVVVTASGASYPGRPAPWTDFPPQQYPADGVGEGECTVGWVLVPVPRGTYRDVVRVVLRPRTANPLEWEV